MNALNYMYMPCAGTIRWQTVHVVVYCDYMYIFLSEPPNRVFPMEKLRYMYDYTQNPRDMRANPFPRPKKNFALRTTGRKVTSQHEEYEMSRQLGVERKKKENNY